MQKGYIRSTSDAVKLQNSILALNTAGITTDNIIITCSLEHLLESLCSGDEIVVRRLSEFSDSLPGVFTGIAQIYDKGMTIRSIEDDWFNRKCLEDDFMVVIRELNQLNWDIASRRTKGGLARVVKEGQRLGRKPGVKNKLKKPTRRLRKLIT